MPCSPLLIRQRVCDSRENPGLILPDIIFLVSDFMKNKTEYHGTPGDLAALMGREKNKVSGRTVSRLLLQNSEELSKRGIRFSVRRSNGKRIIHLYADSTRDDSDDSDDSDDRSDSGATIKNIDPVDPIGNG